MVCPRCKMVMEDTLQKLEIPYASVELGEVVLSAPLSEAKKERLKKTIENLGFELLESPQSALVAQVKHLIIEQILQPKQNLKVNFSEYLSKNTHHTYSHLSRLFSSVEGITIEKYIRKLKIEKAKELLTYNKLNLSQIAIQLNYSSIAYLSTQFKKETGMTPTEYKKQQHPLRKSLDKL